MLFSLLLGLVSFSLKFLVANMAHGFASLGEAIPCASPRGGQTQGEEKSEARNGLLIAVNVELLDYQKLSPGGLPGERASPNA